jgi:hypothetical protein
MLDFLAARPIVDMILASLIVIGLCCIVIILINKKQFITKPFSVLFFSVLYVAVGSLIQISLIFIIFVRQGEYYNYGIQGLYYFIGLLSLPVLTALIFWLLFFITRRKRSRS